jgi:hypothetical protein
LQSLDQESHGTTGQHCLLSHLCYQQAFAAEPQLEGRQRYSAACAALLLAAGQDVTVTPLAPWAADLRHQARHWLLAELEGVRQAPDAKRLASWKRDADLASIRDAAALKALPAAEREAWQRFWAEVDQLLAGPAQPPPRRQGGSDREP